ncbi:MAG: hypothetical protein BGO94_08655 [Micrococcales bacterium 72-143]|nr:MAG: hypothetical protein BGO94_08655 [Micrococcales bacterium 72-143]
MGTCLSGARDIRRGITLLELKKLVGVGALLVVVGTLVACGPDGSPRARLEAGVPVVSICTQIDARTVEFFVGVGDSNPYDQPPIWTVEGSHSFGVGDMITLGVVPDGMEATGPPGRFDPHDDGLAVRVVPPEGSKDTQASWWGADGLRESTWSNGAADDPCG